jgi:hypothetical protein
LASPIKTVPELRGDAAARFVAAADAAFANRGSVVFSKQNAAMKAILKKAKL